MRSVALYGFAPSTREGIWQSQADEIWSIVWAYKYKLPRIDRILEIHPIWMQAASIKPEYVKARRHYAWLKAQKRIPVYMMEYRPEIPMCRVYPLAGVQAMIPPARRRSVFSSSFDYLIALAVYEGYERIECYGFEMGSDTEYRYQREGAAFWIGFCDAHGVDLVLPDNTALLSKRLYGYEGGSMIYRQDLERMRQVRTRQRTEAYARLAHIEGQMSVTDPGSEAYKLLAAELESQYKLALIISGALQECEYYLKEIDLVEPSTALVDHSQRIEVRE